MHSERCASGSRQKRPVLLDEQPDRSNRAAWRVQQRAALSILYCPDDQWAPEVDYQTLKRNLPLANFAFVPDVKHAFVLSPTETERVVSECVSLLGLSRRV